MVVELLQTAEHLLTASAHEVSDLMRPQKASDYYDRPGPRSIAYSFASRGAAHLRRVDGTR